MTDRATSIQSRFSLEGEALFPRSTRSGWHHSIHRTGHVKDKRYSDSFGYWFDPRCGFGDHDFAQQMDWDELCKEYLAIAGLCPRALGSGLVILVRGASSQGFRAISMYHPM